jgi:hypothetical protein
VGYLKCFGFAMAALVFSACSDYSAGGRPVPGPKLTLLASKSVLMFSSIGSAYSQTVMLTAPTGKDGTVTEADNCMTAEGPIATIQVPPPAMTPVSVVVTPQMSGSCLVQFTNSFTGGGTDTSILVSLGS